MALHERRASGRPLLLVGVQARQQHDSTNARAIKSGCQGIADDLLPGVQIRGRQVERHAEVRGLGALERSAQPRPVIQGHTGSSGHRADGVTRIAQTGCDARADLPSCTNDRDDGRRGLTHQEPLSDWEVRLVAVCTYSVPHCKHRQKGVTVVATQRSGCPINLAVELLGDRWTFLVLRDIMFAGKRHFREFLQSEEGISTNILTDRLSALVEAGVLTKSADPTHRQKAIYSLTPKGLDLLDVVVQLGAWGARNLPATGSSAALAAELEAGGDASVREVRQRLKRAHLSAQPSVAIEAADRR